MQTSPGEVDRLSDIGLFAPGDAKARGNGENGAQREQSEGEHELREEDESGGKAGSHDRAQNLNAECDTEHRPQQEEAHGGDGAGCSPPLVLRGSPPKPIFDLSIERYLFFRRVEQPKLRP